jgi:uncharacterized protein YbgA (DUF1722 family)/uncharacterized protein YbbK (DUF523 family)
MEIGLGVPRDRIILVTRGNGVALYESSSGRHLAQKLNSWSRQFLSGHTDIDGFILKHRSPSCGVRRVKLYESVAPDAGFTRTGTGLFAASVLERCSHLAIANDEQLTRDRMREHWLTKLFTLAAFRAVRKSHNSFKRLGTFHTQHRLLLQTYHKRLTNDLDRALTQSGTETNTCATTEQYASGLSRILATPPRRLSAVKPLEAALEQYAQYLSAQDIRRFERQLEDYRCGDLPISEIRQAVQIWAVRYDKRITRQDAVFRPYPGPLAEA